MKVKVKTSPILLSTRVASRAGGGMNEVLHDETLIGNGNNEPLGVNPNIIPDVSNFTTRDELHVLAQEVSEVKSVIPATANPENQLADQGFVNSSIQTSTAHFRGNWDTWEDVPSEAELYPADAHGNHAPTLNDYLVVVDDAQGGTWRYKYTGVWAEQGKDGWRAEYQINETPLTAAQLAALNSGVTAQAVADIAANKNAIAGKQEKLVAGDNITIDGNVISASGGGASGDFLPVSGAVSDGPITIDSRATYLSTVDILKINTSEKGGQNAREVKFTGVVGTSGLYYNGFLHPSVDATKYLGNKTYRWKSVATTMLNNGADIAVPTVSGTLARIEDIDAAVGDISTALTAILGE